MTHLLSATHRAELAAKSRAAAATFTELAARLDAGADLDVDLGLGVDAGTIDIDDAFELVTTLPEALLESTEPHIIVTRETERAALTHAAALEAEAEALRREAAALRAG